MRRLEDAIREAAEQFPTGDRERLAADREVLMATRNVIYTMFVETADRNYLMARQAYFLQFGPDFWWMAEQALEKYFKAILLLNGHSVASYSHDLVSLAEAIASQVGVHFDHPIGFPHVDSSPANFGEAVERVSVLGQPSARYDEDGFTITTADLHLVDQLVKQVREVALRDYRRPGNIPLGLRIAGGRRPVRTRERFPVDEALADPAGKLHSALMQQNGAFGPVSDFSLDSALVTTSPFLIILQRMRRLPDDWSHVVAAWALRNLKLDRETKAHLIDPHKPGNRTRAKHRVFSISTD